MSEEGPKYYVTELKIKSEILESAQKQLEIAYEEKNPAMVAAIAELIKAC